MRSRIILAGLAAATFAFGAWAEEEKATPGDQFTQRERGIIQGTVKGATGNVITLDVGGREPLVQVVVKDEDRLPIRQEGREDALALEQLQEGMAVRTWFRGEGGVRVATSIEVLPK